MEGGAFFFSLFFLSERGGQSAWLAGQRGGGGVLHVVGP